MLSSMAWGTVLSRDGTTLSACPECVERHPNWKGLLGNTEGEDAPSYGAAFGGSYREP
jgi:hypothetical protein